jgi:CHAD domain-containing protein
MESAVTYSGEGLTVPAALTALAAAGLVAGAERTVERTWLDSFDGRLHAAGLRLEARRAPSLELILTGKDVVPARLVPADVPRFSTDLPPGPFRTRISAVLEVRALLPVATLSERTTSAVRRNGTGKIVVAAEVRQRATDPGSGDRAPSCAIETIELPGYPKAASELRSHLEELGLRRIDGDTLDAALANTGIDPSGFNCSPTVRLDATEPALAAYKSVLANLAHAVAANWRGTIDDVDPEFLHELRVAVRRTRSVLSQGKGVLPPEVRDRFRTAFGWLGQITGPARDMDVYMIEWGTYVAPLSPATVRALEPVKAHIVDLRSQAHGLLATELGSAEATEIMSTWRAWLGSGGAEAGGRPNDVNADPDADPDRDASRPVGVVVARRIRRAQRGVLERGRSITPESPADDLHELRKDAKKLRYLLECFGGVLPTAQRKAFVQRLKALQENLGEHQDNEVHVAELTTMARELAERGVGADTLVAIGELAAHLDQRRLAARAEFAEQFASYDTKATRKALEEMLVSAES